jgi:uncharacterized flavoprotein (TIGR03862 family)
LKKKINIIGGGPAAIFCAAFLDNSKYDVTIFEKNKTIARKFLVAGDGGFNLTHSEKLESFKERYTPKYFLDSALEYFSNADLRAFLESLNIETFVGSSGRIYPLKDMKPIQVINILKDYLLQKKVKVCTEFNWTGWKDQNQLLFNDTIEIDSDISIFCLGGASWKITGSDGAWGKYFIQKGIQLNEFTPSNCAYGTDWSPDFIQNNAGTPLKNIQLSCGNIRQKGEVVITEFGLEGNAIYALSPAIRDQLLADKKAIVHIDFKPSLSSENILERLSTNSNRSVKERLLDLKLPKAFIELLRTFLSKDDYSNPKILAESIKRFPLTITSFAPIDEAISTVGGVCIEDVNDFFELKSMPNNYCIGEMIDWDAPTGGYLLQGCMSMGVYLAIHLNKSN